MRLFRRLSSIVPRQRTISSVESNAAEFRRRAIFALCFIFFCFSLLAVRFVWLQVIRHNQYSSQAENNRSVTIPSQPSRGLILDRNGIILARNYWAYSLEITPSKTEEKLSTLIERLSRVIPISATDQKRFKRLLAESKRFDPIPIRLDLTESEMAMFLVNKWQFPGVELASREFRQYPFGSLGAHLLGYMGRISEADEKRIEQDGLEEQYRGAYNIGKVGIERTYENDLRGTVGKSLLEVTAGGRPIRYLASAPSVPGKNLTLSIDVNLQKVAEHAFGGNNGALIAIDPATGEILAFVSKPTYDPNLFLNGIDYETWNSLNTSPRKPLLNRAMRGIYPIGSTYKPFMALAGLESGVITPSTTINDQGVYELGGHKFRDASKVHKGILNLRRSITVSSDVYYYKLAHDLGAEKIHDFMEPWGFGQLTGIDLLGEQKGVLPNAEWKMKQFHKPWLAGDTISLGIGQGYNAFTLLQLSHAVATLANRGVSLQPHLVKAIFDPATQKTQPVTSSYRKVMPASRKNIEFIIDAMTTVTREGTAAGAFRGAPYVAAGKTGTAQVVGIAQGQKYNAAALAKAHRDHGLFISFAPAASPRIAMAVLVENGGWGAGSAAPIARTVLDYWLLGRNSLGLPPPAYLQKPAGPASSSKEAQQ
ncbi:penicillin-binding protein 2 [Mesosutterella sp. OilRF-GAM-744-9]|uniref:Peptidoglycan D,D-transpeptidase MrdA n=1 Tax=Mesosutterella porci TaxID=2915351 RepID=A0ABS9MRF1_9BURK|nr:penicillin-binding protein 2 [Mesosutterella sp. oilRF-744-WT-GAM-9]MCG5031191.1 penicillin-binding protein 2 [Mesosutterella sp. oilRF-744-WT-GAM-9]MCI6530272.1 penicillin-binding protein 2 [Mesosutterella sp.]